MEASESTGEGYGRRTIGVGMVSTEVGVVFAVVAVSGAAAAFAGVLLGWWMRGREVYELHRKNEYLQLQLTQAWARKATVRKAAGNGGEIQSLQHGDTSKECGARYIGSNDGLRWMKCSRPAGHYESEKGGTRHGYAGVFWGEGKP